MKSFELITAGSWHDSIGDLALMEATLQQLALRGIPLVPRAEATDHSRPCVIGGGALLTGRRSGRWWKGLRPCHICGPHVLNAVSVASMGDFSFLSDYLYVSVRERIAQHRLKSVRTDVELVPCTAVLLDPPNLGHYRTLPTYEFLDQLLTTDYLVVDLGMERCFAGEIPDQRATLSSGHRFVTVDTRPWARRQGQPGFSHRNPAALLAVLKGAQGVIAATLHLSIMAMAADVPFVYYEPKPGKGQGYWDRAGYADIVTRSQQRLVERAIDRTDRYAEVRASERAAAHRHVDRMAEVLEAYQRSGTRFAGHD